MADSADSDHLKLRGFVTYPSDPLKIKCICEKTFNVLAHHLTSPEPSTQKCSCGWVYLVTCNGREFRIRNESFLKDRGIDFVESEHSKVIFTLPGVSNTLNVLKSPLVKHFQEDLVLGLQAGSSRGGVKMLVDVLKEAVGDSWPAFLDTPVGNHVVELLAPQIFLALAESKINLPYQEIITDIARKATIGTGADIGEYAVRQLAPAIESVFGAALPGTSSHRPRVRGIDKPKPTPVPTAGRNYPSS